jgi:hypothetical protein
MTRTLTALSWLAVVLIALGLVLSVYEVAHAPGVQP